MFSDMLGRRRAMMVVIVPALITFFIMGFVESFVSVCLGFIILGFIFGLKDAPTTVYVSEVR